MEGEVLSWTFEF